MVYVAFKAELVSSYRFHASEAPGLLAPAVKASVTVGDEITLITRLQNVHDCVMDYSVGIEWKNVDDPFLRFKDGFALVFRCVESPVNHKLSCFFKPLGWVQFKTLHLLLPRLAFLRGEIRKVKVVF